MIERCYGSNLPALENNNFTGEFIMIRIIVTGAAGRMGRRLVANIAESGDLKLAGATERPGSEFLGLDAGTVAGVAPQGVRITDDFAGLVGQADAVIDFSTGAVIANARLAASKGLSIVIGTTALTADDKAELKKLADAGAKIVFASNYSVGVNLLFYLTKLAAQTLSDDFDIEIIEAHHNQKKDAPSGTAVSLAEVIANVKGWDYDKDVRHGRVGNVGARNPGMRSGCTRFAAAILSEIIPSCLRRTANVSSLRTRRPAATHLRKVRFVLCVSLRMRSRDSMICRMSSDSNKHLFA